MIGIKFGKWTVVKKAQRPDHIPANRKSYYECRCECNAIGIVRMDQLKSGRSSGCKPCFEKRRKEKGYKHGLWKTSTYQIWRGIKKRCTLPSHPSYRFYGAIGVTYCERWEKFENFVADMGLRPDKLQIDRIDPYGNYEPGNCRWVTCKENNNNWRKHKEIEKRENTSTLNQ